MDLFDVAGLVRRSVEPLVHSLPEFLRQNRFVLPRMALLLVAYFTYVNRVGEQLVRCSARKPAPPRLIPLCETHTFDLSLCVRSLLAPGRTPVPGSAP